MKVPAMLSILVAAAILLSGEPAPKPVQKVPPAVIEIAFPTVDEEKHPQTRVCSAFYVDLIHLVTAEHCIPHDGETLVMFETGTPLRVIKVTETLALLEAPQAATVMPLKLAKRVEMGERLWAFGYAYGEMFLGYQRNVAGKRGPDIIVDGPFTGGMSGGPIVNDDGEVVGVIQASSPENGIACAAPEIRDLLGR